MRPGKLTTVLSKAGLQANTWIRPTNLHYIVLETDSNQFYNPMVQKIYFDTTNELVKLKYSKLDSVSSRLKPFSYDDNNVLYFNNYNSSVYSVKYIREPIKGDYVCCYDPVSSQYFSSKISKVYNDETNRTKIELEDNTIVNKIKASTNGLRFAVIMGEYKTTCTILADPIQFYIEKNISSFSADVFISTDHITGFEFSKGWWA